MRIYLNPSTTQNTRPGLPGPPEGPLKLTDIGTNSVSISWKPPLHTGNCELESYYIERRDVNYASWMRVDKVAPSITSYCVQNLYEGNEYLFRVSAENKAGRGEPLTSSPPVLLGNPPGG